MQDAAPGPAAKPMAPVWLACMWRSLASTTPLGSDTCTLPVPVTLMAFRFLAPKTAP